MASLTCTDGSISSDGCENTALIIVDVQNDFLPPNGSLSVGESGLAILPNINRLRRLHPSFFSHSVLTCDWHPIDHISFVDSHESTQILTKIKTESKNHKIEDGSSKQGEGDVQKQVERWPRHCVQHSVGAAFHPSLERFASDTVITKGVLKCVDSYSGFGNPPEDTHLFDKLKNQWNVKRLFIVGLCFDFCVGHTALDGGAKYGFDVWVVKDATASVSEQGEKEMIAKFHQHGIKLINTQDVLKMASKILI